MEIEDLSSRILDALYGDVTHVSTVIAGQDVVLLLPKTGFTDLPPRAACFVDASGDGLDRDAFIKSAFQDTGFCIDIIIFERQDTLQIFDATNPRWRVLGLQEMDQAIISCFTRYLKTSNKVFLDPIFDDSKFKKSCWTAFQETMAMLESYDLVDHEAKVRMILQCLIIEMLSQIKVLDDNSGNLCVIVQNMIGNKTSTVNLFPVVIVDQASMPSIDLVQLLASWQTIPGFPEQLDETMLCYLMERSLPENYRKKSGSYYTPRTWAWFACSQGLQAWLAKNHPNASDTSAEWLDALRILDPSMGSGDFLDAMVDILVEAIPAKRDAIVEMPFDWNVARLRAKIDHVFKDIIHGIDVNPLAVDVTRARFFLNALKQTIFAKDEMGIMNAFSIDLIKDDYLTLHESGTRYDIIIGNPPYLMEVRNNQATFRRYSKHPETSPRYEPKMDVFYFFMFKNIDLLNKLGVMSIFVQEYWLDRFHARNLREFVFGSMVPMCIILFKRYKVFQDAPGHHSMLFMACKQDPASIDANGHLIVVRDEKVQNETLLLEIIYQAGDHIHDIGIDAATFYDPQKDKVYIDGSDEKRFFEQLHGMPHHFLADDEIQIGINIPQPFIRRAGEIEGVFVLPLEQLGRMNLSREEQGLLKPFHKATDIDAFSFATREELFIIYTTNEAKMRVEKNPDLYRVIRDHLDHYAIYITSDHKPYGLHRPRQPEWFEARTKIIGIRKTKVPKFAIVPQDYYMDQAAVIIRMDAREPYSPYFICAYLNSGIAMKMLGGMKSQGGQLQIDKSVLVKLPIPELSNGVVDLVSCLSSWLHVLNLMMATEFNANIEPKLAEYIKSLLDTIFKEIMDNGDATSTLIEALVMAFRDVATIHIEDYLVTSSTSTRLPNVQTTRIDIPSLWESVIEALQGLSASISDVMLKISDTTL